MSDFIRNPSVHHTNRKKKKFWESIFRGPFGKGHSLVFFRKFIIVPLTFCAIIVLGLYCITLQAYLWNWRSSSQDSNVPFTSFQRPFDSSSSHLYICKFFESHFVAFQWLCRSRRKKKFICESDLFYFYWIFMWQNPKNVSYIPPIIFFTFWFSYWY